MTRRQAGGEGAAADTCVRTSHRVFLSSVACLSCALQDIGFISVQVFVFYGNYNPDNDLYVCYCIL